ncbi:MAG TPA: acyltransferase family protein [Bryobacteraceae bacterium]|nr:acyltransferase family protein [Bryobacteraceae bacterium]
MYGAFGVDVFFGLSGLLITPVLLEESARSGIRLKAFSIRRAFRILPPALAYIAVIGLTGLIVSWPEFVGSVLFFRNYVSSAISSFATQHLWSLSVILAGTALNATTRLARILDWRFLRWIGRISYSLYLWQQVFLMPGWGLRSMWQAWPLNVGAVLGCAVLSYYILERPMISIGRRLAGRLDSTPRESPLMEPEVSGPVVLPSR